MSIEKVEGCTRNICVVVDKFGTLREILTKEPTEIEVINVDDFHVSWASEADIRNKYDNSYISFNETFSNPQRRRRNFSSSQ